MPKRDRYLYGARMENTCQEIMENIIIAINTKRNEKLPFLRNANTKLELLKVQLRGANEIAIISAKKYLEFQSCLYESGKMLGGWIRHQSQQKLPGGHQGSDYDSRD